MVRSSTETKNAAVNSVAIDVPDVSQLCALALEGLAPMFDQSRKLFCHRRRMTPKGLVCEGVSQRYTIMTVLGLHQCELAGIATGFDLQASVDVLFADLSWITGIGDLGLLLWLAALVSAKHVEQLFGNVDVREAVSRLPDARAGMTTELAWFLAGVAHAKSARLAHGGSLERAGLQAYEALKTNQGVNGILGHLAKGRSVAGTLRSHIGCFADQVYPIYAFTRFAQAFGVDGALDIATSCAESICKLQGPKGQWWWHYDSSTGKVCGKYPVFAVHQDGMAPMALLALSEATKKDYSEPINLGLSWITGSNELNQDLCDPSYKMIWRSIHAGAKYKIYVAGAMGSLGFKQGAKFMETLKVNLECRPYHFGWLLYSFATRSAKVNRPGAVKHKLLPTA
jgi:hypothetical protein